MQDADEMGMAGVRVELWRKGKQLASTMSDSLGFYSFDSRSTPGGLSPKTSYEIRIAYIQERHKKLSLSAADPAVDPAINNDGVDRQEYAVILFTTEALGISSNSLDFGFKCVERPQVKATLACTGTNAADAMVKVTLKGVKANERFDLTLTKEYSGTTEYVLAHPIPPSGSIFTKPLLDWESDNLTARVINATGCFQDVYVSLLQSKECIRLFSEQSNTASERLQISPNPTPDKVVVHYRGMTTGPVVIQVLNGSGKVLHQESLSGPSDALYRTTLDLSRYQSGLYIISLQQGSTVLSRKIIRR
ncbi:T9SS type A sorting domain-containing protein [Larkinella sp. VNQ87]|uniref:T9SS type A sorting domain-containing protein n=1 Tax=Larkinella sp. VNQ87 TaxID=3400921 RepID=UPI003C0605F5